MLADKEIIGHVVKTGVRVNVEDAYKDARFNSTIGVIRKIQTSFLFFYYFSDWLQN